MPQEKPRDSFDDENSNYPESDGSRSGYDPDTNSSRMTPTRMAGMLNFEEGEGRYGEADADIAAAGSEYESSAPYEAKSKRGFESNPIAKVGLIGGLGLLISLLLFSIVSGWFAPRTRTASSPQTSPTPQTAIPGEFRDPNGEKDTELALSRQQLELEALRKRKPAEVKQEKPNQPIVIRQPTPRPAPVYTPPPPPQPVIREVARPAPIRLAPPSPPPAPVVQLSDPADEWLSATEAGAAGQIQILEQTQQTSEETSQEQVDAAQEAAVLTGQRLPEPVKLISGTKAKGVLTTPVAWGANTAMQDKNAGVDRFIVTLQEPMKAADGSEAIPSGTQLITQMNAYSQDGLIDLSVVSAVVNMGGQQQEIPISGSSLKVSGKRGEPLIAKMVTRGNVGSGFNAAAMRQGLLGAAKGAAEELTKADVATSTSTSSGGTTTSTSSSTNDRNVGAGVVKGGSDALLDVYTDRSRANLSQLTQQRPARIWVAKAGTQVEVFVTQSTDIPRVVTSARTTQSSASLQK